IVLLENDGILPLDLAAKPVIAVIGANAEQKMSQGGLGAGVKTLYEVTPLEGLKNKIGDKAEIIYAKGYESTASGFGSMFRRRTAEEREKEAREKEEKAKVLMQEAVEVASKAGVVLFIGGNNRTVETEGSDRRDIMLPAGQDQLISEIARVNPNIVTVLVSGAPNDLTVVKPLSRALLISWFNGTEGGNALADVLTGNISPGGRLPFTLPLKLEDSPAYALGNYPQGTRGSDVFANLVAQTEKTEKPEEKQIEKDLKNDPNTAIYSEESLIGYRWFDTKKLPVMYPFGYGLTYSEFEYANLKTDREKYGQNDVIKLSLELKNSGPVTADEVVQAYVHRINPSVEWPYKELKAFSRETLAPGEIRQVTLEIPVKSLQYWDEKLQSWNDDLCNIELQVGASAGNVLVKKEVTLK
ncbi:MAG TPA: glycoside hydrolase family 3 C-terminal domain-containing protein, partial [Prolixibacteraceae bacterium]|nr:glycoside hydrolase family 3 C-terminal domain-containing protein [Prolixibacteraceae bacterium]